MMVYRPSVWPASGDGAAMEEMLGGSETQVNPAWFGLEPAYPAIRSGHGGEILACGLPDPRALLGKAPFQASDLQLTM